MPVTNVTIDDDLNSITVTAEFPAPPERVWQVWEDPRQLERWWGPPEFPASVTRHEFTPGGTVDYAMKGPDGSLYPGRWVFGTIDAPHTLTFADVFVDSEGATDDDLPEGRCTVTLEAIPEGTRMTTEIVYADAEALRTVAEMGMEQGITQATNQIDGLLASPDTPGAAD